MGYHITNSDSAPRPKPTYKRYPTKWEKKCVVLEDDLLKLNRKFQKAKSLMWKVSVGKASTLDLTEYLDKEK